MKHPIYLFIAFFISPLVFADAYTESAVKTYCEDCEESQLQTNSLEIFDSIQGQLTCDPMDLVIDSGYRVNSRQVDILASDQRTSLTRNLSNGEIHQRIKNRIQRTNSNPRSSNPDHMAKLILRAANAFGLDPFIFAAMIEKESTYNINARSPTGAVGLSQMTNVAKQELRHQYGYVSGQYSAAVPPILKQMTDNYFGGDRQNRNEWYTWVQRPNERELLRNFHTSIVAGAALLKFYLAVRKGDYGKALVQYNGSNIKHEYSRNVRKRSQQIDFECPSEEIEKESMQMNIIACEISGDPEACRTYVNDEKVKSGDMWDI